VLARANEAGILHIATHADLNRANPLYSALQLASGGGYDGLLKVHEVYSLDLSTHTALVVLSGCETAVGTLSRGDEFVGLNRAFLTVGAPTVIASLWKVPDNESTALLMERFYTYLLDGMNKTEALRRAQIDVRAKYPHPYYWASFVLTGDPESMIHQSVIATSTSTSIPTTAITSTAISTPVLPISTDIFCVVAVALLLILVLLALIQTRRQQI
jgi:CHAT domain-containing protein